MSTPDTLPRRILRGSLWTIRKALALAVALAVVGVLGFALTMVGIILVGTAREMGLWDFTKG